MPQLQFDLLVADIRRDAQDDLRRYTAVNLKATAGAVIDALAEHGCLLVSDLKMQS